MQATKKGVVLLPIIIIGLLLAGFVLTTTLNKTISESLEPLVLSEEMILEPEYNSDSINVQVNTNVNESSSNSINQKTQVKVKIENGEGYIRIDNNGEITQESF